MPFCTQCGANVTGSFCTQCGTPLSAAAAAPSAAPPPAAAQPQPPPPPQYYAPPAPPPVQARKTSPIVWVLVIVLGLFVLGGIAIVGVGAYIAHRVHQAVRVNDRDGGFSLHTRDSDGKDATLTFGGSAKIPSWVPAYPGSEGHTKSVLSANSGGTEGGDYTFTTSDDPAKVKAFYSDKCKDLGLKVEADTSTPDGGMIVAADENGDKRSLTITVGGHSGETTVNVIYGRK